MRPPAFLLPHAVGPVPSSPSPPPASSGPLIPPRLPPQLELLLVRQAVVELAGRVLPWLGHLLHEQLGVADLLQHLPLVGLAQHAADVHLEQDHEGLVQAEHQIELAHRVEVPVEGLGWDVGVGCGCGVLG